MRIMQTFCQALYQEIKIYEANKTKRGKKLNPIREQDITRLTQLLETAEKQNPTDIRVLYQEVAKFLNDIKTARFIGIPIASDLRIHLWQILVRPEFDPTQMVIIELQEQQANQRHINQKLNTDLTLQQQEIDLLKTSLKQRDNLCEALKTRCSVLEIENTQLKASLNACADGNTAERLNQLHRQVAEQQTTISKLTVEHEKEKSENQRLKAENQRLEEENSRLKNSATPSSTTDQSVEITCYPSPLNSKSPHPNPATINTATSNLNNSVELKTYGC